jgi:hypothetical protein
MVSILGIYCKRGIEMGLNTFNGMLVTNGAGGVCAGTAPTTPTTTTASLCAPLLGCGGDPSMKVSITAPVINITGVSITGSPTTITAIGHNFIVGNTIEISGVVSSEDINGEHLVIGPVTANTFTINQNVTSVTLSGGEKVNRGVDWLGETWTPAEALGGVFRCVCPITYVEDQYVGTTLGYTAWKAAQQWIRYSGVTGLALQRGYMAFKNTFTPLVYRANFSDFTHQNVNVLKVAGETDNVAARNIFGQTARPVPVTYYFPPTSDIGKVAPETVLAIAPSDGAATLTADFFGNHTGANGITYTWQKALGW